MKETKTNLEACWGNQEGRSDGGSAGCTEIVKFERDAVNETKTGLANRGSELVLSYAFDSKPVCINGRLNLSTKEVAMVLGSIRLFQRMRHAKWIVPLYRSRDQIYPSAQIFRAQQRLESGERPPLLPSEIKQRAKYALN